MLYRFRKLFTRSFDGAQNGRRWRGQPEMPATLSAMHAARGPLARRARYLAGNNALAASGVEAWVSALIGTGIKPQSGHVDPEVRAALNLAFESWTDDADADGLTDFYGLQALLVRRWSWTAKPSRSCSIMRPASHCD
jgi:capsid protein